MWAERHALILKGLTTRHGSKNVSQNPTPLHGACEAHNFASLDNANNNPPIACHMHFLIRKEFLSCMSDGHPVAKRILQPPVILEQNACFCLYARCPSRKRSPPIACHMLAFRPKRMLPLSRVFVPTNSLRKPKNTITVTTTTTNAAPS